MKKVTDQDKQALLAGPGSGQPKEEVAQGCQVTRSVADGLASTKDILVCLVMRRVIKASGGSDFPRI